MRIVTKPTDDAREVFTLCISGVRDADLKRRLTSIEANIASASAEYETAATATALHTFPQSGDIGLVDRAEMIDVYVGRMVPKTQPGRSIYDKLINEPEHQTCPLCGVGTVNTLDHHLPKAYYTNVAVTPTNLIPSCERCQIRKKQKYPRAAGEQTLHPYYDDFTQETWLRATVIEERPASFFFFADPPNHWHADKQARVLQHMESFDLASLYATNSANHLSGIRRVLTDLWDAGGSGAVRDHLRPLAGSFQGSFMNSWDTAMYDAASANDWFCDGGFVLP